jgi:hypothetical protein
MNGKISPVLIHVLGCLLFLALPVLFAPETTGLSTTLLNRPTQRDLLSYVLLIGLFYANYMWVIPHFYFKKRYLLFGAINLCCLVLIIQLPNTAIPQETQERGPAMAGAPAPGTLQGPGADTTAAKGVSADHMADAQRPANNADTAHAGGPPGARPQPPNGAPPDGFGRGPGGPPPGGGHGPQGSPPPDGAHGPQGPPPGSGGAASAGNATTAGGPAGPAPGTAPSAPDSPGSPRTLAAELSHHLFLFLACVVFALALRFGERWKQTEKEKLQAELAYLKAQVNPHFLFNTLNGVYALALEKSDKAPEAIARLAAMMRYVLHDAGRESVPLDKELTYIRDYMALQEVRFAGAVHLDLSIEGDPKGKKIAPLVLIPFIENAFKHGVNPEEESRIDIRILVGRNDLRLEVVNKKVTVHLAASESSGLGIATTRERLQLLYPGAHTLDIRNNSLDFIVFLWLNLQ